MLGRKWNSVLLENVSRLLGINLSTRELVYPRFSSTTDNWYIKLVSVVILCMIIHERIDFFVEVQICFYLHHLEIVKLISSESPASRLLVAVKIVDKIISLKRQ